MEKEFYYCYSPNLHKFIKNKGIKYICRGRNTRNGKVFWLYGMTNELSKALSEYSAESVKYRRQKNESNIEGKK